MGSSLFGREFSQDSPQAIHSVSRYNWSCKGCYQCLAEFRSATKLYCYFPCCSVSSENVESENAWELVENTRKDMTSFFVTFKLTRVPHRQWFMSHIIWTFSCKPCTNWNKTCLKCLFDRLIYFCFVNSNIFHPPNIIGDVSKTVDVLKADPIQKLKSGGYVGPRTEVSQV